MSTTDVSYEKEISSGRVLGVITQYGFTKSGDSVKLTILYDPKIMQLVGIELNPGPITSTQFSDIVTF